MKVRAWNEFNYLLTALVKHRPSISFTTNSACCAGGKKRGMQGGFERSGEPGLNECMERLSVEPSASHRDYGKVEIEVAQQYRPGIQGESSGVAARQCRSSVPGGWRALSAVNFDAIGAGPPQHSRDRAVASHRTAPALRRGART
jgi:hypothetical protein